MKKLLFIAALCATLTASAQKRASSLVSIHSEKIDTERLQNAEVRLSRPFFFGYNTLCMPYDLSADEVRTYLPNAIIEKAVGGYAENGEFVLCFQDCTGEAIEAGLPYLVRTTKAQVIYFTNSTSTTVETPFAYTITDGNGNLARFTGSFERLNPIGPWAIPAVEGEVPSDLICCDGERRLEPTRCFFTWDEQQDATTMVIRHLAKGEPIPTGLVTATLAPADFTTYNLAGQRTADSKGITIKGGRKVMK